MNTEIYSIINTLVTIFLGGGWFLHWRASRRKAEGEAMQTEAQANKEAQEYYNTTLADVNRTLNEVRQERDNYKVERNELQNENHDMRAKYIAIEEKLTKLDLENQRKIARLGRQISVLSPFLCGTVGCINRQKANIIDNNTSEEDKEKQ